MLLFLALTVCALLIWGKMYERLWRRSLTAHVHFAAGTVYAGDQTTLTEEIANRKRLALPEIEAAFRVPKGLHFEDADNIVVSDYVYKRDIFALRGMEAVRRSYTLSCRRRGRYPVSQLTLRGWSFFHSRQYELPLQTEPGEELVVFAGHMDVSQVSRLCDVMLGEMQSRRSLYEDPFALSGIRDYRPGDPMKRINWKASARTGELMVNTYDTVRSEQLMIFLDVSDERIIRETQLVEAGIRAAASLCRRMIRKGQDVALAVNTDPPAVFEPQRGTHQLEKIEYYLTEDLSEKPHLDLAELFHELTYEEQGSDQGSAGRGLSLTQDRVCVVISKEADMEIRLRRESGSTPEGCGRRSLILVTPYADGAGEKLQVRRITL